jgi:hypothetical protein
VACGIGVAFDSVADQPQELRLIDTSTRRWAIPALRR